jgi:hypothetical protein
MSAKSFASQGMKSWADMRKSMEVAFRRKHQERLPWDLYYGKGSATGNIQKVLYLMFYDLELEKAATVVRDPQALTTGGDGLGFFQITSITVPREHRAKVDSSPVPSLSSMKELIAQAGEVEKEELNKRYKALDVYWKTAGLSDSVDSDGNLVFTFQTDTFKRQKQHYPEKAKRPRSDDDCRDLSFEELIQDTSSVMEAYLTSLDSE